MAHGNERAILAAEKAISSPLLETSMEGARSILLSITGGSDLSLVEVSEAAKVVGEAAHPDANIIFGANVDDELPTRSGSPSSPPASTAARARSAAPPSRPSAAPKTVAAVAPPSAQASWV